MDGQHPPHASTGADPPDYVVLSEFTYRVFQRGDPSDPGTRLFADLMRGRLGYVLTAAFETVPLVPLRDLLLNPRILIFRRTSGPSP